MTHASDLPFLFAKLWLNAGGRTLLDASDAGDVAERARRGARLGVVAPCAMRIEPQEKRDTGPRRESHRPHSCWVH